MDGGAGPAEPPASGAPAPVVAFKKKKRKETIRAAREVDDESASGLVAVGDGATAQGGEGVDGDDHSDIQ